MGKNHPNVDPYIVSRVRALESLLLEKGILAPDAVDRVVQRYESATGPMGGARAGGAGWCSATSPTPGRWWGPARWRRPGPIRGTGGCCWTIRGPRWRASIST